MWYSNIVQYYILFNTNNQLFTTKDHFVIIKCKSVIAVFKIWNTVVSCQSMYTTVYTYCKRIYTSYPSKFDSYLGDHVTLQSKSHLGTYFCQVGSYLGTYSCKIGSNPGIVVKFLLSHCYCHYCYFDYLQEVLTLVK